MSHKKTVVSGFSLVEVLVAIAVISILAVVVITNANGGSAQARDTKRIAELKEIENAILLYYQANGHLPRESDGANGKIGEGGGLDSMLAPYLSSIPVDPNGPGDSRYFYYYDGQHNCFNGGVNDNKAIVYANAMETLEPKSDQCESWGTEGRSNSTAAEAYNVVISSSDG